MPEGDISKKRASRPYDWLNMSRAVRNMLVSYVVVYDGRVRASRSQIVPYT